MSTKEAANYLDISERTIFRLLKRELIKAERFGHYWVVDRGSVEEYKKTIEGKARHDPTRGKTTS